jgi:hypothetical protein
MKRRTFKQLRAKLEPAQHHHVYVVLLDPAVGRIRKVRAENPKRDPEKPCVYVGSRGDKQGLGTDVVGARPKAWLWDSCLASLTLCQSSARSLSSSNQGLVRRPFGATRSSTFEKLARTSARNGIPPPRGLLYCIVFLGKSLVRVLSQ